LEQQLCWYYSYFIRLSSFIHDQLTFDLQRGYPNAPIDLTPVIKDHVGRLSTAGHHEPHVEARLGTHQFRSEESVPVSLGRG
jgi:hypothetical protein